MKLNTLYITDLDGTLLNNGSFVSPRSADILASLTEDGAMITVATARTPATVVPLMQGTGLDIPYIVLTGAAFYDPVDGTYIDPHFIPADDCALLDEIFARNGVNPFVYSFGDNGILNVYHSVAMNRAESDFYTQRCDLPLKRFHLGVSNPDPLTALYFATGDEAAIRATADEIAATDRFSASFYPDIFTPTTALLEVFGKGVSKASAVNRLREMTGADRVVVFGDNLNDIPMFEVADLAVAVSNAHQRVREAANIVIGPNFDDSVARFITSDFYNL